MLKELNKQALHNPDWSMKNIQLLKYQKDRKMEKRWSWNSYPNIEKTETAVNQSISNMVS